MAVARRGVRFVARLSHWRKRRTPGKLVSIAMFVPPPDPPASTAPDVIPDHADTLRSEDLIPEVYDELRRLARARLRAMRAGETLQTTALVHEAYLRLAGTGDRRWNGRPHFFGAAARAMRLVLIDHARHRGRLKRHGQGGAQSLTDESCSVPGDAADLPGTDERIVLLGEALGRLDVIDRRKAEIASLHLFIGMTHEQIAEALEVSVRTVEREWRFVRAWLQRELDSAENPSSS